VSLQIAILKVLSGHRDGRTTIAALNADLKILNTSRDWNERMRRLAALAGPLNIFSQNYVAREPSAWQLTAEGYAFLRAIEAPDAMAPPAITEKTPSPPFALLSSERPRPAIALAAPKDRRRRHRRTAAA
jgi:hypothetical protein